MAEIQRWGEVSVVAAVTTAALLLLVFLTIIRTGSGKPRHRLPPGPRGWPILGSLLSLGTLPHRDLYELSKRYGPLMSMRLGSVQAVVVTSPQLAEEVLKTHDLIMSSRPQTTVSQVVFYDGLDVVWSPYGQYWRYLRKICTVGLLTASRLNQFRDVREREVLDALHFVLEKSQRGNDVNMIEVFSTLMFNNITQMMMSKNFSSFQTSNSKSEISHHSELKKVDATTFEELMILLGSFNIGDYVPVLKRFDPQSIRRRAMGMHRRLDKFFEDVIEEHRQRVLINAPENYKEDFVDALLGIGQTKELQQKLSNDTIKAILLNMLTGGADTSSASSLWVLTELMRHPHVMRRVQEELDSVVGPHRLVQEEDIPELKYLHAVIWEAHRLHPVAPLIIHQSTADCEIQGFHIPARTQVFVNVWGMHRDPAVWKQPLEFEPDRFLNSSVNSKGLDLELVRFGNGRRICPGMNLGSLMVAYPLALFLHSADWTLPEGQRGEELDISEAIGAVLTKKMPLTVYAKARLSNHLIYPVPNPKAK